MTMANQLVAVDGLSEDEAKVAGAIVYWRLSEDSDGDALASWLELKGVPREKAPCLPSPKTALGRTMQEVAARRSAYGDVAFVRRHKGAWWAVYELETDRPEPEFVPRWGVSLDIVGRLEFQGVIGDDWKDSVQMTYDYMFRHLSRSDVGSWLVGVAEEHDAVPLRDTGGVYFVPSSRLESFKKYVGALHQATSCRVHLIPALHADTSVEAVLDALVSEVEAFVDSTGDQLGDLTRPSALKRRAESIERMAAKVERFEGALGRSLEGLQSNLATLHARAVEAALAAMPDEED